MKRTSAMVGFLLVVAAATGCDVAPSSDALGGRAEDPAAIDAEVKRVFDDAACWCESFVLQPYEVVDTPASLRAQRLYRSDVAPLQDNRLFSFVASTTAPNPGELGDFRECSLSQDAARGSLSDRRWSAADGNRNACTGWPIASIRHELCRAEFDHCLGQELGLAASSSTRPLPAAVQAEVRAESVRRFESAATRAVADLARLRSIGCPAGSTDPDCVRLATGYETALYTRVSDAASTMFTAAHEFAASAQIEGDSLTPGLVEGTSYGAEMFGPRSSRVRMMQALYGNTRVTDRPESLPSLSSGGGFGDGGFPIGSPNVEIVSTFPASLTPAGRALPIRVFREQDDLRLAAPLTLSGAGAPVLPAGTVVDVFLVHFASMPAATRQTGSVTFSDRRVLGILTSDAQLIATHPTLGRSGTTYFSGAGVGLEAGDVASLGARSVALDLTVATSATIDELRIVTFGEPDADETVVAAERGGDLPFASRLYGDVRTARALGLLARYRIGFPHTACLDAATGEVTASAWAADPRSEATRMLNDLQLAVQRDGGGTGSVLDAFGLRAHDIADAIDYVRDAESTLEGLVLAPQAGCGPSIVRTSALLQRNPLTLQAAFARSGRGAIMGASGTSWYTPSAAHFADVGTVGTAHILRVMIASGGPIESATAAANDTLALIDAEIGSSWSSWRVCEDATCAGDPQFHARWTLVERLESRRPEGVPVLVARASDARCVLTGSEPLAPDGATCAHVTSNAARYAPMSAVPSGLAPGACDPVGPYCRRSFTVPNMRLAAPDDRRFVLWCAREPTDPAGACRSYELVDVIYTGAGPQVHAFGGAIGAMVAKSFAVDPNDPAFPMFNSLGFARDFVPPLENELIDDGDNSENSWESYLASATRAQVEATTLLEAARQHELEQLAFDRTVEIQIESAIQAQQETVSSLCGADTPEATCDVPRVPVARFGPPADGTPGLELLPDPGPSEEYAFAGGPYDCTNVVDALEPATGVQELDVLAAVVSCTNWQVRRTLSAMEIRDLPVTVFDEVQRTSQTGVPGGDFGSSGGSVRQQLITLYQDIEDLRAFARSLDSTVAAVLHEIRSLRLRYQSTENSWFNSGWGCRIKAIVTTSHQVAELYSAAAGGGGAGAIAGGGGMTSFSLDGQLDACDDADLERKRMIQEASANMVRGVEAIVGLTDHARRTLGKVASADATFDDIARQVELARSRREIAERLATSGVQGDPTWRALMGVERRRADQALLNAQRYAFVARRAIETRLAIDMTSMTSPEPYVDGPAFWVNDVFDLGNAIEYVPVDGDVVAVDVRAEAMEDYLHSLHSFADGYPFGHNFTDGDDEQIVNLGEVVRSDPFSPGFVDTPFVSKVLFRCRNSVEFLPGGVPAGYVVADPLDPPEPCGVFTTEASTIDLGGVESASFSFTIPVDLGHGYFGERLSGGNINYRIQDLSVNLVARPPFDCERATRPTECYGDGNVQYSMRHEGETVLENWDGDQRFFAFEPGVIQRARALANERWLTNPLSSTDEALLANYTRDEWRGRPLAGTYTLEVQSRDELEWRNLENVQVLIRYHYWTRQR